MDDEEPIVHMPRDGETLKQYLDRYTTVQRQRIYEHKTKLHEFCTILLDTEWAISEAAEEESIQSDFPNPQILEHLNRMRLQHIRIMVSVRRELLRTLEKYEDKITVISVCGAVGRIAGFAVESLLTIGGLCLSEFSPDHANWAFCGATCFGVLGLVSTVTQVRFSADALGGFTTSLSLIRPCYQQSSELEKDIENVFPFELTNAIVQDIVEVEDCSQFNPAKLLPKLFQNMKSEYMTMNSFNMLSGYQADGRLRLIEILMDFPRQAALELYSSLFERRIHPVFIDIARISLQFKYSYWPFYTCQCVAALMPVNQRLFSVPVLARLALNIFTITHGISFLRRSEVYAGENLMRSLRTKLEWELSTLSKIERRIERI